MNKIIVISRLLIILIPLVLSTELFGQEASKNAISLSGGEANLQIQNLTASPMIHSSWSPVNAVFRYERTKKLDQQFYIKFSQHKDKDWVYTEYSAIWTDDEMAPTYPHQFILLDINYSLGKQLLNPSDWKLTVGGRSGNSLNLSSYDFGPAGSTVHYWALGLDVWLKASYDLGEKHQFVANLALPIFSWVARSPYLSQDGRYLVDVSSLKGGQSFVNLLKDGSLQSWSTRQSVNFDLAYYYKISDKWQLGAGYWLLINFNQDPQRYGAIENIIQLSGKFNF